jgi:hypothetical protein
MQMLNAMWIINARAFVNIAEIGNSENQLSVLAELRKQTILQYNITVTVICASNSKVFFLKKFRNPAAIKKIAVKGTMYMLNKERLNTML